MPVPKEMTYVEAAGAGGPEVLRLATGPVPVPKPGDVLIRVMATGVNRPDVAQRAGSYPPPPGASPILGLEVAGEVVALGEAVTDVAIGDRVCALANGGGYAEYCATPATQCLPWPEGYDAIRAAALPETYFTVWANVFMIGRLGRGGSLLVHGGTSGIGVTAIRLGDAFGATVYVTAGSADKCEACRKLGAADAFNYRETDFLDEIGRVTGGRGVDVVLDMVGAPYTVRNIRALALDGRLVQIAFLEGSKVPDLDLMPVMRKRLTITGSTMRPRTAEEKGAIAAELRARVWPMLDQGRCGPVIYATFPLAEAAAAHQLMESSAHIGKIMLDVTR
ncbi:MAG TPA: NAD(P)H-quinone oxidoreductase [Acetobacteraceae bacterium]|nr:NAD(P)H-quinone oxidoreductase [Acetobacteraceae bacterium]